MSNHDYMQNTGNVGGMRGVDAATNSSTVLHNVAASIPIIHNQPPSDQIPSKANTSETATYLQNQLLYLHMMRDHRIDLEFQQQQLLQKKRIEEATATFSATASTPLTINPNPLATAAAAMAIQNLQPISHPVTTLHPTQPLPIHTIYTPPAAPFQSVRAVSGSSTTSHIPIVPHRSVQPLVPHGPYQGTNLPLGNTAMTNTTTTTHHPSIIAGVGLVQLNFPINTPHASESLSSSSAASSLHEGNADFTEECCSDDDESNNQRPSLLQSVSELEPSMREKLLYVAVHVERKDVTKPWGLGFTQHGYDRILISKANMDKMMTVPTKTVAETAAAAAAAPTTDDGLHSPCFNGFVSWAHVLRARDNYMLNPHVVYNEGAHKSSQDLDLYAKRLLSQFILPMSAIPSQETSKLQEQQQYYEQRLLPGDLIVAVDGKSMGALENRHVIKPDGKGEAHFESSLQALTSYLRKLKSVTFFVLRMIPCDNVKGSNTNPYVTISPNVPKDINDPVLMASNAKYKEWSRILPSPNVPPAAQAKSGAVKAKSKNVKKRRPRPVVYYNPWFQSTDPESKYILYDDNSRDNSKEDGTGAKLFLPKITNFRLWLSSRKQSWRKRYCARKRVAIRPTATTIRPVHPQMSDYNPWFKDFNATSTNDTTLYIPYDDDICGDHMEDDGTRGVVEFYPVITDFGSWLSNRKRRWRELYTVHTTTCGTMDEILDNERDLSTVPRDFWTDQGYGSFDEWLKTRVVSWKRCYSWHRQKKRRIQQECEAVVHLSLKPMNSELENWLKIRRNQWRIQRRRRQRSSELPRMDGGESEDAASPAAVARLPCSPQTGVSSVFSPRPLSLRLSEQAREIEFIDEILEAEEEKKRKMSSKPPFDIARFFDSSQGMPDDAIVVFMSFLNPKEHGKVLSIDTRTSKSLKEREEVWKRLCPKSWTLPRRPRKPWHFLYLSKLRKEHELHQKRWDDLLIKIAGVLSRSDAIQKVEKLVKAGEAEFGFEVNYISPVVMERNSILNLAVINGRHKIVRWLIEKKEADIESFDRGRFTPLANAAWAGDRIMVRYLMSKGSNRAIKSTQHSSQPIAPPEFKGLTPDQWAEKKGHDAVARLIRDGL